MIDLNVEPPPGTVLQTANGTVWHRTDDNLGLLPPKYRWRSPGYAGTYAWSWVCDQAPLTLLVPLPPPATGFPVTLHHTTDGARRYINVDYDRVLYADEILGGAGVLVQSPDTAIQMAVALYHAALRARDTCRICGTYAPGQGNECGPCFAAEDAAAIRREDR